MNHISSSYFSFFYIFVRFRSICQQNIPEILAQGDQRPEILRQPETLWVPRIQKQEENYQRSISPSGLPKGEFQKGRTALPETFRMNKN
jgi:hypothetical protein